MQFNSYLFILACLPVFVMGYFLLNKINISIGKIFLMIASAIFYIYGGLNFAAIFGVSIIINLILSIVMDKITRWRKTILIIDIISNVALLFYFKYFNFFIKTLSNATGSAYNFQEIALPLGISFFTFQQIMYVVHIYRKSIKEINLIDYLSYILYFPKLLMGPLVEPADLISQLNDLKRKDINWDSMAYGIKLFSFGLFKKMVLADTFAAGVSWGYENMYVSTSMDWFLIMLFYTFEIYFDFSGYSDMSVGISKMLNIDLPINFDSPYKALSIRDFWKRWHMSLTGFFTKYIYIPLGGGKKGKVRTYINTMIVFLISGIWHGANWTFILWGALHGLLSVLERIFEKKQKDFLETVRWSVTFFAVNILWLLFRSDSIEQWRNLLLKMFTFQNMEVSDALINIFVVPETSYLFHIFRLENVNTAVRGFSMLLFIIGAYFVCLVPNNNNKKGKNNWLTMVMAAVAFIWSFLCLSSESVFVYSNF